MGGVFKVSIFVDGEPLEDKTTYQGIPIIAGRPNFADYVPELAQPTAKEVTNGSTRVPHVFVCGPPGMTAIVDTLCLVHDVSFHTEVFAY